ncbi:MAG: hypothetical protein IPJ17_03115 [Holophagales bacterium]|nr:MAG: hypothetical protein IPJ17_03115 [Holophagales bacterium]
MDLVPGSVVALFDRLQRRWDDPRQQRLVGSLLVASFAAALAAIEARRQGWLPDALAAQLPASHFHAVSLAFTLLLLFEVIGVVFSLAHSVSESVGKQFEIFSLILLRQTFKELTTFTEPVGWDEVRTSIGRMASDAFGALAVFALLWLFYRIQRHRPITADAHEREHFVATKKGLALLLLGCFAAIAADDLRDVLTGGEGYNFFVAFYTLLIFSDILLVLVSLRYSSTYPVVFRNSGFAAATVFLRLALTAPPYLNAAIGLASALFICGLTAVYNRYATTVDPHAT